MGEIDPFVLTNDIPKAFRVGECKVVEPGRRTQFEKCCFFGRTTFAVSNGL
jgi:hypothetical protein